MLSVKLDYFNVSKNIVIVMKWPSLIAKIVKLCVDKWKTFGRIGSWKSQIRWTASSHRHLCKSFSLHRNEQIKLFLKLLEELKKLYEKSLPSLLQIKTSFLVMHQYTKDIYQLSKVFSDVNYYRVFHGFKLTKRDDYFWVTFTTLEASIIFEAA